ncbi:hypothetical protein Bca4012_047383 [Brassica carinata]|uniref:Uncharacterized protein n=2 Tax=Brassica TaxID=3705 RepID=A0A0D3AHN6_BRAOL|nr:unnamed protein product [Brassica napus]
MILKKNNNARVCWRLNRRKTTTRKTKDCMNKKRSHKITTKEFEVQNTSTNLNIAELLINKNLNTDK